MIFLDIRWVDIGFLNIGLLDIGFIGYINYSHRIAGH